MNILTYSLERVVLWQWTLDTRPWRFGDKWPTRSSAEELQLQVPYKQTTCHTADLWTSRIVLKHMGVSFYRWKGVNKLETVSQDQGDIRQAFQISLKKSMTPLTTQMFSAAWDALSGSVRWPAHDRRLVGCIIILSLSKNVLSLKMTL